jgi:hypothetical protein
MSAKATPGPWRVFADVNIQGGKDGRRGIATTGGTVDGRVPDQGHGENLANARLIAAAPAMAEALEMILTVWFDATATRADDERAEQAARDALRLAKGE